MGAIAFDCHGSGKDDTDLKGGSSGVSRGPCVARAEMAHMLCKPARYCETLCKHFPVFSCISTINATFMRNVELLPLFVRLI